MNYGALISEAFWISWRNRFLWVFGFFLSGGQIFNLLQNANNFSMQRPPFFGDYLGDDTILTIFEARRFVLDNLVPFLVLAVILVLAGIFVSLTSRGALIDSVAALHRGEERGFSSAFRAGLLNFWRVLGFFVVFILISIGIGLFVFLPAIFLLARTLSATNGPAVFILVFVLLIGVLLLVFIPLGIIFVLGLQALVLDREGVFASFGSGYRLLIRRPGRVLLVALISFALGLVALIGLLTLALILGLLLAVPALILFTSGLSTASLVAGVVAGTILLVLYLVAAAAVTTFNYAYWTLAYLQLTAVEGEASVEQ